MSNFVFQFYHPADGKGGIRPLIAVAGDDIKEAFVTASRKAISLYGKPGGVLGVVHAAEEVVDKTDAEVKQIFAKYPLQSLPFKVTGDLLDKINEPLPVTEQTAPPAATTPAATATTTPAKPARRRGGNASLPKPVTADSVVEDDPERDQGKSQFKDLVSSAIRKFEGLEWTADTVGKVKDAIVQTAIDNCPNIQDLDVVIEGTLVKVKSSFGNFEAQVFPPAPTSAVAVADAADAQPSTPEVSEKPAGQ